MPWYNFMFSFSFPTIQEQVSYELIDKLWETVDDVFLPFAL